MCISVPAKIVDLSDDGFSATVITREEQQTVNLMMLDQQVQIDDYLLVQVGGFAVEKIEQEEALKAIALIKALEEGDFDRAAELY